MSQCGQAFLNPVLERAARYLRIVTHKSDVVDLDDMTLVESARMAVTQIEGYLNRPLERGDYVDRYPFVTSRHLPLRVQPVTAVTEVKRVDTVLTTPDDYTVDGNCVVFPRGSAVGGGGYGYGLSVCCFPEEYCCHGADTSFDAEDALTVRYRGGLLKADDDEAIVTALATQAAANYKRASTIGLRQISGGGPTGSVTGVAPSDAGGIIGTVRDMIDRKTYLGAAVAC